MRLTEILNGVEIEHISGNVKQEITGIAYDSRNIRPGNIFVCIQGTKTDGHAFIDSAIHAGAAAIVVDREVGRKVPVSLVRVSSSRRALAQISANFFGNPTEKLKLIGVTGTNGKTTVTHLIKSILENTGEKSGLIGTIGYQIVNKNYQAKNTTPESFELQSLFHEMTSSSIYSCVMEVSSHALEMSRVEGLNFNIGIFTNLTPDHLDFHQTIENYMHAKMKLFHLTSDANIVNIDDPYGVRMAERIDKLITPVVTYGIDSYADIMAKDIEITTKGSAFTLVTDAFEGRINIATPGRFSVYNALAASAAAYVLGIDFNKIKTGLEAVRGVPGRFELIPDTDDVSVIVDYAHTPDALENVLKTIKEFANERIITVFGCGGDRDEKKRPMMGEIAGKLSDITVITSDNPRSEEPEAIIAQIENGIKKTNGSYEIVADRREAIKRAIQLSAPGDTILIAGKGHENYQILKDVTIDFDDRKVAVECLWGEDGKWY